jgi:carbon-monoxide dehydrogenase large subunit
MSARFLTASRDGSRPAGRREDLRFVTGRGRYTDDLALPGLAHAVVLRSAHPHALIRSIAADAARAAPGVLAVLTAAEAEADGLASLKAKVELQRPDGSHAPDTPRPLLAGNRVRHVGEPVALVVAESRAAAEHAAELVSVDYEPLPGIARIADALAPGAPVLWDSAPDNVAFLLRFGDAEAVERAFAAAAHVTAADIDISRVTAASLEPRSATGAVEDGRLVLRASHQNPFQLRENLTALFGAAVRVIVEDVGGSFGMKSGLYREDALVLWAARRLGRPVRWTASRAEAFLADDHAREMSVRAELALDAEGMFLALRADFDVNIGAYLSGRSLPLRANIGGIAGVYRTPHIAAKIRGVLTNTAQTSAYRGAGRPEVTYILERLIDIAAAETGTDPFELRRQNLVPPEAMPFRTGLIYTYDSGDFGGSMEAASELIDRPGFAARRAKAEARGKLRGLGLANPIEVAGGPFAKPRGDVARIAVTPDGAILLDTGVLSTGQGLETAMSDLVAARLGVDPERIRYRQGDTDRLADGRGSGGSSAAAVGGPAVTLAVERLIERGRALAADALEASAADLEFGEGRFRVVGTDRGLTLAELAARAASAPDRPSDQDGLVGEGEFLPGQVTYPNGCHICEVEIDPETGQVEIVSYVAVEDVGRVLNATLVEGQMHGGIAQGAGQAVKERIVHDSGGELVSGSFSDYGMPLAADMPAFRTGLREIPTTANPLGVKGVGEAGTVGALAATMNAVCDALRPLGIRHLDMPASPERVWRAIRAAKAPR